jgi:hypothetical protein
MDVFEVILLSFGIILLAGIYLLWFRPWQLRWGARDEEIVREMPGDTIVKQATFDATRGVSVKATPEEIYPWIVQMGVSRAGWYSYDILDNLGRRSAEEILPEFQKIAVGDVIPMSPDGKQGMFVKDFVVNEWVLWGDHKGDSTWVWGMYPEEDGSTRLITRVRVQYRIFSWDVFFNLLIEFADIWMMRKCMRGIKWRAEKLAEKRS